MSMSLRQVISQIAQDASPLARLGVVTAIDEVNASLTVDVNPGDPSNPALLTGIRWFSPYIPTVDDMVGLIAIGSGWWVLGKNSFDLRQQSKVYGQAVAAPSSVWTGLYQHSDDWWNWSTGEALVGTESTMPGASHYDVSFHTLLQFSGLDIPSGSTIISAYLSYTGQQVQDGAGFNEVTLATHNHTAIPSGAPTLGLDYAVPFDFPRAQPWSYQLTVPSDIVLSLAAGYARGIAVSPLPSAYGVAAMGGTSLVVNFYT